MNREGRPICIDEVEVNDVNESHADRAARHFRLDLRIFGASGRWRAPNARR